MGHTLTQTHCRRGAAECRDHDKWCVRRDTVARGGDVDNGPSHDITLPTACVVFRVRAGIVNVRHVACTEEHVARGITTKIATLAMRRRAEYKVNLSVMYMYRKLITMVNHGIQCTTRRSQTNSRKAILDWLASYLEALNVPKGKAEQFIGRIKCRICTAPRMLSFTACGKAWTGIMMSTSIGNTVDKECKDVFNGLVDVENTGPVTQMICTQLSALKQVFIAGGVKVAYVQRPDASAGGCHNGCSQGCAHLGPDMETSCTEVDLVSYDRVRHMWVLLELKTMHCPYLDKATMWRYNLQLWLTWLMFSATYPSIAERTCAYLLVVRPGEPKVYMYRCTRPNMSTTLRRIFPWLSCMCKQVRDCAAPHSCRMRTQSIRASSRSTDPMELSHRNRLFNALNDAHFQARPQKTADGGVTI